MSDRGFLLGEIDLVMKDLFAIAKVAFTSGDQEIGNMAKDAHATMLAHLTSMLEKERRQ